MPCLISSGRVRACKDGLGGNSTLYLFDNLENAFTVANGEAITMDSDLLKAYKFELEGDGNTLEESMVGDRNTGSRVNTQTLTVNLKSMDAATSANLNLITAGYPQAVIVDRNGNYIALGLDDGIDFTVVAQSGGAKSDMNGYVLTGVSTTSELAPHLDATTITQFLAVVEDLTV